VAANTSPQRHRLPVVVLVALLVVAAACAPDHGPAANGDGAGGPPDQAAVDPNDAATPGAATDDTATGEPSAGTPGDGTSASHPTPVRYVALGDSIAAGTAAGTSYVEEYAAWLAEETATDVALTHAARPGWTTDDLLTALEADELRAAVAGAHVVTFNIGGNDLLAALRPFVEDRCGGPDGQACLRDAVDDLTTAWDELLAELLAITGGDADGLRTMDLYEPRPLLARAGAPALLAPYLDEINEHLVTSAERHGIEVARVHAAFAAAHHGEGQPDDEQVAAGGAGDLDLAGLLARDGIHPNDAGHASIAAELARLGLGMNAPI
jgi:lysophospholipase L1-like esterase